MYYVAKSAESKNGLIFQASGIYPSQQCKTCTEADRNAEWAVRYRHGRVCTCDLCFLL